jgi:hypothetical protein
LPLGRRFAAFAAKGSTTHERGWQRQRPASVRPTIAGKTSKSRLASSKLPLAQGWNCRSRVRPWLLRNCRRLGAGPAYKAAASKAAIGAHFRGPRGAARCNKLKIPPGARDRRLRGDAAHDRSGSGQGPPGLPTSTPTVASRSPITVAVARCVVGTVDGRGIVNARCGGHKGDHWGGVERRCHHVSTTIPPRWSVSIVTITRTTAGASIAGRRRRVGPVAASVRNQNGLL